MCIPSTGPWLWKGRLVWETYGVRLDDGAEPTSPVSGASFGARLRTKRKPRTQRRRGVTERWCGAKTQTSTKTRASIRNGITNAFVRNIWNFFYSHSCRPFLRLLLFVTFFLRARRFLIFHALAVGRALSWTPRCSVRVLQVKFKLLIL